MHLKERFIRKWYHDVYEFNDDFMLIVLGIIMNLLFLSLYLFLGLVYLAISFKYCRSLLLLPFIIYYIICPWIIYCRSYSDDTVATMDRKTLKSLSNIFEKNFIIETKTVNSVLTEKAHLYTLRIKYKKHVVKIPFICYLKYVSQAKQKTLQEDIDYYKNKLGVVSSYTKEGKKEQMNNTKKLIEEITQDIEHLREDWKNG